MAKMNRRMAYAGLAQAVINIDAGITTIEKGSRIYEAMVRCIELENMRTTLVEKRLDSMRKDRT